MLEVDRVTKAFDGFVAVREVSLTVERGTIAAVIGPNGAGKTTLFNLITGHLPVNGGRILLRGRDITGLRAHQIARLGVSRSFQRINVFPRLTAFANIQAAVVAHRGRGLDFLTPVDALLRDETEAVLASVGLTAMAPEVAGRLSYGDQKRLELGIALASDPQLLLLDEPTAGMSPAETRATIQLIERIAGRRGLTLLFTEHDMNVVFAIAQRITVLHQGEVIASGPPAAVREDPRVRSVYLGERQR